MTTTAYEFSTTAYETACARAATSQGLDPLALLLDVAGVEYEVEQTGGFCMVLTVTTDAGTYGVTKDGEGPADWLLAFYPGNAWTEGEPESDYRSGFTLDETVATLSIVSGAHVPTGPHRDATLIELVALATGRNA